MSKLSQAKKLISGKILRAVSRGSVVVKAIGECHGPFPYQCFRPNDWLTQMWDVKSIFGWSALVGIDSLASSDTDRAAHVSRSLKRAVSVVHTLLDFAFVANYKRPWSVKELESILFMYMILDVLGVSIPNLKYHTLYIANVSRGQVPPERTDQIYNLDGWLLDFKFRRFLQRAVRKHDTLGETILQGLKRGCPSMDERGVEKGLNGLKVLLGDPHVPTPPHLLAEVARTAEEMCPDFCKEIKTGFQLSPKAGFETGRPEEVEKSRLLTDGDGQTTRSVDIPMDSRVKCGGIRGAVWRWVIANHLLSQETQLYRMEWGPHCGLLEERRSELEMQFPFIWESLYEHWKAEVQLGHRSRTKARVCVIFEPNKIRPITAGQSLIYAMGKVIQAPLWKAMQQFPLFQLTGTEVTGAAIARQVFKLYPFESTVQGLDSEHTWFQSADYQDATNRLHSDCTKAFMDAVFIDGWDRRLAEVLLGHHMISIDRRDSRSGERVRETFKQNNGQLMGSMISFPVLCCINAAILRYSLEQSHGRVYSLYDLPALINGDDLLFRGSLRDVAVWSSNAAAVGFIESPGKSYLSKDWVQINSRTFDVEWCPDLILPRNQTTWINSEKERFSRSRTSAFPWIGRERGFVNFGIIEGFEKGTDPQDEPSLENVAVRLSVCWRHFDHMPGGIQARARSLFLRRITDRFERAYGLGYIPYMPSLSNPEWAGGLNLFSAPFDCKAANTALRYRYVKPTVGDYLSSEVEGQWAERSWNKLPDEAAFVKWHERQVLLKYRG